jgi:hypothetical protein
LTELTFKIIFGEADENLKFIFISGFNPWVLGIKLRCTRRDVRAEIEIQKIEWSATSLLYPKLQ